MSPEEIAYVGDRLDNDILPAANAGLFTVWIKRGPWAFARADDPEGRRAHLRIDTLDALLRPFIGD